MRAEIVVLRVYFRNGGTWCNQSVNFEGKIILIDELEIAVVWMVLREMFKVIDKPEK
jgi:hypothetical protein